MRFEHPKCLECAKTSCTELTLAYGHGVLQLAGHNDVVERCHNRRNLIRCEPDTELLGTWRQDRGIADNGPRRLVRQSQHTDPYLMNRKGTHRSGHSSASAAITSTLSNTRFHVSWRSAGGLQSRRRKSVGLNPFMGR